MPWAADRVLSFVVDRAIFGQEVFEQVLADPALHLITWEKGYEAIAWPPPAGITGAMMIERARNRAEDIRSCHLEYCDRSWPKDERLRQLVVQATNAQNRVIQVSILTDDRTAAAVELIRLMFNRWVQENDFKYLDKQQGLSPLAPEAEPVEKHRRRAPEADPKVQWRTGGVGGQDPEGATDRVSPGTVDRGEDGSAGSGEETFDGQFARDRAQR
jgi:hypothetical protein